MKKTILALVVLAASLAAQEQTITIEKLPATIQEFEGLRDQLAKTPEGGAAILIVAAQLYVTNRELGKQALTVALDQSQLSKGNWYKGFEPSGNIKFNLGQLEGRSYVPFAYNDGATAENGYKVNPPFRIIFSRNQTSGNEASGTVKVFVKTYGVMPRPITMTVNNKGIWKARECSSIFVAVKPPGQAKGDDL
ncbi:MAG: hypothetical protein N2Z22_11630 [Turneriella sp.]|nr:hypothetical protein [Turneriella sp.]